MAKKQQRFEGTEDESDKIVRAEAQAYVYTMRARMGMQEEEAKLKEKLVEIMKLHKMKTIVLDDGTRVDRVFKGGDTIKTKQAKVDD